MPLTDQMDLELEKYYRNKSIKTSEPVQASTDDIDTQLEAYYRKKKVSSAPPPKPKEEPKPMTLPPERRSVGILPVPMEMGREGGGEWGGGRLAKPLEGPAKSVESFIEGVGEALDPRPIITETYKRWKEGDLPGMAEIISGGFVSKDLLEGKTTGISGIEKLNVGAKALLKGNPVEAANEAAKAIPFFGPMLEAVQYYLDQGEYAKAAGLTTGILIPFKAGQILHNIRMAEASAKAAKRYERVAVDTSRQEAAISQMPEGSQKETATAQVEKVKKSNKAKAEKIVQEEAQKAVVKADVAAKARQVKERKKMRAVPEIAKETKAEVPTVPEKSIEDIMAPVKELEAQQKAKGEPIRVKVPSVMRVSEVPSKINETQWVKENAPDIYREAERRTRERTSEIWDEARRQTERAKIAQEKEFIIQPDEYAALDAHFDDWTEVPTSELVEFLQNRRRGKVEPSKRTPEVFEDEATLERELAEIEAEFTPDKMEIKKGVPAATPSLSKVEALNAVREKLDTLRKQQEAEVDAFLDDIDLGLGVEESPGLVGEVSPFRTDPSATKAQSIAYGKNPLVAASMEELTNPSAPKDPMITSHKLMNDFNRWLDGEEVSVEQTRNFLSDLASKTDDFKWTFMDELGNLDVEAFSEWKDFISEGAKWARKTERGGVRSTLTSLYMGLPIDEAWNQMKVWYSALRKAAEVKLPNKVTGAQLKNTFVSKNSKGEDVFNKGVTEAEWRAIGLEDIYRPEALIEKSEILKRIDESTVEFKDVILEDKPHKNFVEWARERGLDTREREAYEIYEDEYGVKAERTKFSSYQEPGGSNYKELFVTAPATKTSDWNKAFRVVEQDGKFNIMSPDGELFIPRDRLYNTREEALARIAREKDVSVEEGMNKVSTPKWQDGHSDYSDIENPIVRLRMNDRVDAQGNKVLFLEELQPPVPDQQAKMPPALQKRWREIGMKRAIKYALDNGYDKVAWTTGEMQANRYSLDKQISSIDYWKNSDGTYQLWPNGVQQADFSHIPAERLPEYVGAEVAQRIIGNEGEYARGDVEYAAMLYQRRIGRDHLLTEEAHPDGGYISRYSEEFKSSPEWKSYVDGKTLQGLDLKNEEKGLRKLYDQGLPNVAKKLGGRVESVELPSGRSAETFEEFQSRMVPEDRNAPLEVQRRWYDEIIPDNRNRFITVSSISLEPFKSKIGEGFSLYSGIPIDEIVKRLGKIHPATYPKTIQKTMAAIAYELKVTDILDIFAGIGNIGKLKEYGYTGNIRASEIEPKWGGESTKSLHKARGVDESYIGDSRKLPIADESVQAIFTSPTYGNMMAARSPSRIDTYQALAGGKLKKGNTGGEVWGPEYEKLHREAYDEAYRIVKPGGFFVLNMKDKPVSAVDAKNNWIPKRGSTVEVRDNVMKATDWHIRALEDAGFEYIETITVEEAKAGSATQLYLRRYTTGTENIVVMGKPDQAGKVRSLKANRIRSMLDIEKSWSGKGQMLYSGIPLNKLLEVGKLWKKYSDDYELAKHIPFKVQLQTFRENFNKHWLSQSGNIRRALEQYGDRGHEILQAQLTTKNGHPRAVNKHRQLIKEYDHGLSKELRDIRDQLILAERMLSISKTESGKKMKYPEAFTPERSKIISEAIGSKTINGIRDLTPEEVAKIRKSTEAYFEHHKMLIEDRYKAGLIGKEERDNLIANNFEKFRNVKDITPANTFDRKREVNVGGKKIQVYDSGIDTLAKGRTTDILEKNSALLALEEMHRTYAGLANNEAMTLILDTARRDPNNPFARVSEPQVIELAEQPKKRTELVRSIHIKKNELAMSDYEYKARLKKETGHTSTKQLTDKQLAAFDTSLGGPSKGYAKGSGQKIPKGWKRHFVYENGARKIVWLEPKFSGEFITSGNDVSGALAKTLKWLTLTPVVRTFATTIEPVFALANFPRDITHALFAARTFENGKYKSLYQVTHPTSILKMPADFKAVFKDAFKRTGRYNDYIDDGAGMDFLVVQGRPWKRGLRLENVFDKALDFFGYLNETSEILTRLAVRERVIKNEAAKAGITVEQALKDTKIRKKASFAALDMMNFGDTGGFSRAINNVSPYFSARLTATRSLFRTFKPGSGTAAENWLKIATFGSLITALYIGNHKKNPKTMEQLRGDGRNLNYLIIPLGDQFGYPDPETKQMRYPYIKIPIDSSQVFFKTLFEALTDKWLGKEVDANRVIQALKNSSPVDVTAYPPLASALTGYWLNKDFWNAQDIWKQTDKPLPLAQPKWISGEKVGRSEEEYLPGKTPQFFVDLGKVTGLSPERAKYMAEELYTSDSTYAKLLLYGYEEVLSQLPEDYRQQVLADALSKVPGIKRFYGVTNPQAKGMVEYRKLAEKEDAVLWTQNRGLDERMNRYFNATQANPKQKSDLNQEVIDYISGFKDKEIRKRMIDDYKFTRSIRQLPNRQFWLNMKRLGIEQRAEYYLWKMRNSPQDEIDQINKESAVIMRIGGIITKEFRHKVQLQQARERESNLK